MKKLLISKIRIALFFLALVGPILACQSPSIGSECEEVDRSFYEQEARVLGEVPETPEFPEGAVYKVCYTDGELTSVQMKDGNKPDEDESADDSIIEGEKSDEEDTLVATYIGTTELPPFQQEILSYTVDENQTVLNVYEDGKVIGEQVLIISYTQSGVDDTLVYATTSWKIALQGTLEGEQGELSATLDYHFVSGGGPGESDIQDQKVTTQFVYEILLVGDMITNATDSEMSFLFEAYKQ